MVLAPLTGRGKGAAVDSNVKGPGMMATRISLDSAQSRTWACRDVLLKICVGSQAYLGTDPEWVVRPG